MCRSLLLSALVLIVAVWALGCGGNELAKNAISRQAHRCRRPRGVTDGRY